MLKKRYDKIGKDQTKRFLDIFQKLSRLVSPYRKRRECQKEVFIRRTLNKWLSGKYFEVILEEGTGFFKDAGTGFDDEVKEIMIPVKRYVYISDISFTLNHSYLGEVDVRLMFGHEFKYAKLTLPIDSFLKLEFKEIDQKKYKKIQELFVDDRT
jgi:hypothetical protein